MVEDSYKEGPSDCRLSAPRRLSLPDRELATAEQLGQKLDWAAFEAQFFPDRRRHDLKALAAYAAYRSRFNNAPLALEAAVSAWEGEGGAIGKASG